MMRDLLLKNNCFFRTFIFIVRRAGVLYCAVALLVAFLVDYGDIAPRIRAATVSRSIPAFGPLINFIKAPQEGDREVLKGYLVYFDRVIKYIPTAAAEGNGMAGYCYYYLGEHRKAMESMSRAAFGRPQYFYFHYNLGVMHFERRDFSAAIKSFEKAISISIRENFDLISTTKFYKSMLTQSDVRNFSANIFARFQKAYYHSYLLLLLSCQHARQFSEMYQFALQAMQLKLNDTGVFSYYAGLAALSLRRYPEAMRWFDDFIRVNPNYAKAHEYLALTVQAMGGDIQFVRDTLERAEFLRKIGAPDILFPDDIHLQVF